MMGDFKPLRRKLGVMTLLIASVFAAGWVRSFRRCDHVQWRVTDRVTYHFLSNYSSLVWQAMTTDSPQYALQTFYVYHHSPAHYRSAREGIQDDLAYTDYTQAWQCRHVPSPQNNSFHWGEKNLRVTAWRIPYWSVEFPLVAISAWLLLSTPGTPKRSESPADSLPWYFHIRADRPPEKNRKAVL